MTTDRSSYEKLSQMDRRAFLGSLLAVAATVTLVPPIGLPKPPGQESYKCWYYIMKPGDQNAYWEEGTLTQEELTEDFVMSFPKAS